MPENWVDIAILLVVAWNIADGVRRGFILSLIDLLRFALSLIIPLTFYVQLADWVVDQWAVPGLLAQPLAFVGLWAGTGIVVGVVGRFVGAPFAALLRGSALDLLLSLVPSAVKGLAVAGVILTILFAIPPLSPVMPGSRAFAGLREAMQESQLAAMLVERTAAFDRIARELLGEPLSETLTLLTVRPEAGERIDLNFRIEAPETDPSAEEQMLRLLNDERTRLSLTQLVRDSTLDAAARAHSVDMLQRGYFAHETLEGRTPLDRMRAAGSQFSFAGENLALAPTVALAHQGLMESPGHRANILGPEFRRVGIGAARADGRGRMFTQSFAN